MTCPDWRLLCSRRDRDPEAWERGLEHFDGCGRCRDQALAEEPTLMFRRLPAPTAGKDEIAAMKQAVAVLRRSSRRSERADRRAPALHRPAMLRAAALAALVIGAATLQGTGRGTDDVSAGRSPSLGGVATVTEVTSAVERLSVEDLPLIEAVDPSYGSVVQVVDDEISLVLVLPNDV